MAVGISDKAGELTLYGDGGLATFDCGSKVANLDKAHTVPIVTLLDIFNKYVSQDVSNLPHRLTGMRWYVNKTMFSWAFQE